MDPGRPSYNASAFLPASYGDPSARESGSAFNPSTQQLPSLPPIRHLHPELPPMSNQHHAVATSSAHASSAGYSMSGPSSGIGEGTRLFGKIFIYLIPTPS